MEIKVYTADVSELENEKNFQSLYCSVSTGRRAKVDRMIFGKDKRLSLGAGALLENALALEGVTDLEMMTMDNKKPCLAHRSDIKFNISHSGTKVMCAVSNCDIGCDVEKITDIDMDIAKQFFFAEEYAALMNCRDKNSRNDLFFRYWTLKESFMKATGLGFELALDEFCIIIKDTEVLVRQSVDTLNYYFAEFDLEDGYKYAVCSVGKPIIAKKIYNMEWLKMTCEEIFEKRF